MKITGLLIANRGEIAIRVCRTASEMDIRTVTVYSEDDATCLHTQKSDESYPLNGNGVKAYLDTARIIEIAQQTNCNAIHPGYGFLSEQETFAQQCAEAGILFIGPSPNTLRLFGNKAEAKELARQCGVPVVPGTNSSTSLEEALTFRNEQLSGETVLIKAISGGGGRGMRLVSPKDDFVEAFRRCQSEAMSSFGNDAVYLEKYIPVARHIEVQIIGDGSGLVSHLGERECSIQRRNQKLIEIAPCPGISRELQHQLVDAAMHMASAVSYASAGTFEFLTEGLYPDAPFYFIEANPRLQVEHTVTEEVMGIDLVRFQIQQALGKTLLQQGLTQDRIPIPRTMAMQLRINMEKIGEGGNVLPQVGSLSAFELPSGPGIRIDTMGYHQYRNNPNFDSLLAKLICHSPSPDFQDLVKKAYRATCEFHISGIQTNLSLLQNILQNSKFRANRFHTRFIDAQLSNLINMTEQNHRQFFFRKHETPENHETKLPLPESPLPEGTRAFRAPMPGSVVSIQVQRGESVRKGQQLLILEAMKMENVIYADSPGIIKEIAVRTGDVLLENQVILLLRITDSVEVETEEERIIDLDEIRPDLAEVIQKRSFTLDENRPEAVARRRKRGQRTAWENVLDLCDVDTFREYGAFAVAAQRNRRSLEDLQKNTPADGFITGLAQINGHLFSEEAARSIVLAYDFTVLAGTQGSMNHQKLDRMLHLAQTWRLPVVLFAEGGGGRPGDIDQVSVAGLDITSFYEFAKLSGQVPLISIVSRYCFAGNAALAGCSDVIIATRNTSIGMGGPAMIEGGGLGKFHPAEVGPVSSQTINGVIDILVEDESEAVAATKKYLSYFQGSLKHWEVADQRQLRQAIPENRKRIYDIRNVISLLADQNSVLEIRPYFGVGMITAFIRIEGQPMGLIANNPAHLAGAIDSDGADKASRFMRLCNAYGIPILSLCDTPGIMVGPDAEKSGTVRRASRMFVMGAALEVPIFTVVLRKGYGLGAMAMAAGGFHATFFTISWPTGEFGAMGLEGAIRLGFRKELERAGSPEAQKALYDQMVADAYENGKALNMASFLEIDEVIDPVDTRKWILSGLQSIPPTDRKNHARKFIDTW